jgi:hypothetical protein
MTATLMKKHWKTGTMYTASKLSSPRASQWIWLKMKKTMKITITHESGFANWFSPDSLKLSLIISATLLAHRMLCAPRQPLSALQERGWIFLNLA